MNKSEIKKKIKALGFLILILGSFTTYFNIILKNILSNDSQFDDDVNEKSESFDFSFGNLEVAAYSSTSSGTGEELNISLQQSIVNEGSPLFRITNASDPNNNTFNIDCPDDNTFNTTFSQITMQDIYAPNASLIIEDYSSHSFKEFVTLPRLASFTVTGNGYLENISIEIIETGAISDTGNVRLRLYNSTWDSTRSKPGGTVNDYITIGDIPTPDNPNGWYNLTNAHIFLNNSKTENNTWFIGCTDQGSNIVLNWWYTNDDAGGVNDGDDETDCWEHDGSNWVFSTDVTWGCGIDFHLKVDLSPEDNIPLPTDINLKVNNSIVNNAGSGSGIWTYERVFSSLPDKLDYILTADWWNVSCNIVKIEANYTKTDLKAIPSFEVLGSGLTIQWNASAGNLNYFDPDYLYYKINFTVPSTWSNLKAFNDTVELTDNTTLGEPLGGYMEYQIYNASNGPNWFITAESQNLLDDINMFVDTIETTITNYDKTIDIIGNFTESISDGNATVEIYSPDFTGNYLNFTNFNDTITTNDEVSLGSWTIKNTAKNYGQFRVQVFWSNNTAVGFVEKNLTIWAITDLLLIEPAIDESYYSNDVFNITFYYNDTGQSLPIENAQFNDNSSVPLTYSPNGTAGFYTTEIIVDDFNWGWNFIEFNASRTYYNEASVVFSFQKIINTTISPSNIKNFGDIIKGDTVSYEFNYSDINDDFIEGADIQEVDVDSSFIWFWTPIGQGNYSIELNTTNVDATPFKYICNFSISATGNETQIISLQLRVINTQTFIDIQSYNSMLIRKDRLNQTVVFYFNDTDNNKVITGLTTNDIIVKDNQTGSSRSKWLYLTGTPGLYELNISTSGLNSGWIRFELNVSLEPNYNWSLNFITFYLRGNLTDIPNIFLSDPGGEGTLTAIAGKYPIFEERDLYVDFNITDTDYNNNLIKSEVNSYLIEYIEIGNPTNQGTLTETISFDANTNSFKGYISITDLPSIGNYALTVKVNKINYEEASINFNITIKARFNVELQIISKPSDVTAGDTFRIVFRAQYNNGTNWLPLIGSTVIITPTFDGITSSEILTKSTNSSGGLFFDITVDADVRNISLSVRLEGEYYHVGEILTISDINIIPLRRGLTFGDLVPGLITTLIVIAAAGASVSIYRGVIVPKKRERTRILTEVKTIFDDAINLEHILVLYKGTGTCIYFKSFGSEQIDPELISGFISAISSFGKDLVSQEELNEITYGDKMLLLSDGEFIRVALVLGKKASIILRRNLMDFIHVFERHYDKDLPSWRGQLNIFRDAGVIVDDKLNTSIILPHEITYEYSTIKVLKKSQSKEVLKIANTLMKESERNFFFIATLLKEAAEKTSKDTPEIFMGIKELRDTKILMPIEISTIETKPISQQELNLINQKVSELVNLSREERQKLVNDLSQMGPAEREAYFVSLTERHEIVSAPIESKIGAAVIETPKGAKKEIKNLKKNALAAKKEKDYEKSIKVFQNASKIALNWELIKESQEIDDLVRLTKIEDLTTKMKNLEKEAKLAVKKESYTEAAQKYKISSKIASEIFKLGVTDMTKEVKRLSNKSKEYEKLV
ncbi:MAG: hypothetical protein ACFE9I_08135 [Candidatus Hermodarchaeota archaeon]